MAIFSSFNKSSITPLTNLTIKNMNTTPFQDELTLKNAFAEIAQSDINDCTRSIVNLVCNNSLSKEAIQDILSQHAIDRIQDIKMELLDVLIAYANFVLKDSIITGAERANFEFLKMYFKICEGDFYRNRHIEIESVINKQLENLYADNTITENESIDMVLLQDMFDLSYDQLDQMKEKFVTNAINQGAIITNLDTGNKKFIKKQENKK